MMAPRWEFLAPWWRILQSHELTVASRHRGFREQLFGLTVCVDASLPSGPNGASEEKGDASHPQIPQLRDALELALLLAVIDRTEFVRVVRENAPSDVRVDAVSVLETHPEHSLTHVDVQFDGTKPDTVVLAAFIAPQPLEDRDPAFQEARRRMLAHILPSETDKHAACEHLTITVRLAHGHELPPLELMRLAESVDALSWTHHVAHMYPFVAAPFSLYVEPTTFTEETITEMNAWHARGARLPFDCVWINSDDWPSSEQFGQALSAIFQPFIPADTERLVSPGGLDKAIIFATSDRDHFAQLCSAVMHTRLVRSLTFSFYLDRVLSAEERRFRLRWATHSIQEVELKTFQLSDAEFQDLHQLLWSENPLPFLFEDSTTTSPNSQVLASKGSTMTLDGSSTKQGTGERPSVTISQGVWLDVIGKELQGNGDWLVLVPAYGKCHLRQADGTEERALQEPTGDSTGSRGITSLHLEPRSLRNYEDRGIFPFLRWVGPQLEVLTLSHASFKESNALVNMLTSCSSLKRLHLPYACAWIIPQVVQAYETGMCKASSLDLRHMIRTTIRVIHAFV